jgi:predicted ATPase
VEQPGGLFLPGHARDDPGTIAEQLSKLMESYEDETVTEVLQIIEPRLKGIGVFQKGGEPVVYGNVSGLPKRVALPLMGEGMARLLRLALAIPHCKDGLVLVDEFETGLHHSIAKTVWKVIGRLAREYNVQLFATTHSNELIRSAHEAFQESDRYDFLLHRLDVFDGSIHSVTYDQETLATALDLGWEVR